MSLPDSTQRFAHLTLPTRDVDRTAAFLERTFAFTRGVPPANSPVPTVWLEMGGGQQVHVVYVDGFEVSPFEGEFGRHIAVLHPENDFDALRERLTAAGAEVVPPLRATSFERFFVREPINGYVFEVIEK